MSTVALIVVVIVAVIVLLAVGGAVAGGRRRAARAEEFRRRAEAADVALAEAFATDKGWERTGLEGVARRVWAERHGGEEAVELALVAVVDLPGTDEDRATFYVRGERTKGSVTLARRGQDWLPV